MGTALERLEQAEPEAFAALGRHLLGWAPLHYALSNAATSVAWADPELMTEYAGLVRDEALRRSFLEPIVDELWRTRRVLEALYGGPLAERRPNVEGALRARAGVLGALHRRQVSLLAAYRAGEPHPPAEREARLAEPLLTVNALAAGLGGTG